LTVVLSETDWRALRAVEPDAVGWLQQRIRERIGTPGGDQKPAAPPRPSTNPAGWGDDVY
jgi:hypothetical protein